MNIGESIGQNPAFDFTVDTNNLYREEAITDLKVASIRVLTPVKTDGSADPSRKIIYLGHTQLMTPQGALPIQSQLKAQTLDEAIKEFPVTMKKAMDILIEDIKRYQKEQADNSQSRIISPR